jgi:hypothetical protein
MGYARPRLSLKLLFLTQRRTGQFLSSLLRLGLGGLAGSLYFKYVSYLSIKRFVLRLPWYSETFQLDPNASFTLLGAHVECGQCLSGNMPKPTEHPLRSLLTSIKRRATPSSSALMQTLPQDFLEYGHNISDSTSSNSDALHQIATRTAANRDVTITTRIPGTTIAAAPFFQRTAILHVLTNAIRVLEPGMLV